MRNLEALKINFWIDNENLDLIFLVDIESYLRPWNSCFKWPNIWDLKYWSSLFLKIIVSEYIYCFALIFTSRKYIRRIRNMIKGLSLYVTHFGCEISEAKSTRIMYKKWSQKTHKQSSHPRSLMWRKIWKNITSKA